MTRGVRTLACRVRTLANTFFGLSPKRVHKIVNAARRSAHATFVALLLALSAHAQLTPPEQRGKKIYTNGGSNITATLGPGGAEIPASQMPCANCHGSSGTGNPEGGTRPPNITWQELATAKPTRPAYTEALLKRAISMGIDSAARPLQNVMPRFRMSLDDIADLVAYIKQLANSTDPGLSETSVTIGVILPPPARFPGMAQAIRAALTASLNDAGEVYGRHIDLRFVECGDSATRTVEIVRAFLDRERPFAMTAGFIAGAEPEFAAMFDARQTPLIGAFTNDPTPATDIFYLYPSVADQSRALAAFVAKTANRPRVAVAFPTGSSTEAIQDECRRRGWPPPLVDTSLQTHATFLVPSSLATPEMFHSASTMPGRLLLAYPALPAGESEAAAAEYRRLARTHNLPPQHTAAQWTAIASVRILVEGLKRAGKDLSREKLIAALESLYEFPTGLTHPVSYSKTRHTGAPGAYIVSLDAATKKFINLGWFEPDRPAPEETARKY
jgi:ABC-type branched-subunit amino acid transport system substrate-binding protein